MLIYIKGKLFKLDFGNRERTEQDVDNPIVIRFRR